jgi:hypothetical protein
LQAAELAAQVLGQWLAEGDEPLLRVEVNVRDLITESESLDVVRELSSADLARLKSIGIKISGAANVWADPRVDIKIDSSSPALSIEVRGGDRTGVEGLTERLVNILDGGGRRPRWYQRYLVLALLLLPFLFALLGPYLVRAFGLASQNGKREAAEIWAIIIGLGLGAGIVGGLWFLTPDLQLLATHNDRTRFRHFRGAVWGVVLAILASIIATLLLAHPTAGG